MLSPVRDRHAPSLQRGATWPRRRDGGLRSRGVEIHHFTSLVAIVGKAGRVSAVETGDGTRIPCDLVAIAIGVAPRKELA